MPFVHITRKDGLAELTLDRPKVNALNRELLRELSAALVELAADTAVRGVLWRATGSCFSAGLDLRELASLDDNGMWTFLDELDLAFTNAFAFPKPLAVAAQGHAIAGGLILALTADFLALKSGVDLKVGLSELKVGVPFPRVAFEIVSHALPGRSARAMRFSADLYPAEQGFAMGVGDVLVADPETEARRWLETAASRPAETFRFVKRQDRELAMARVQHAPLAERQALVAAIGAARSGLTKVLG